MIAGIEAIKLFISYTHDSAAHSKGVLDLSKAFRREGFDCDADRLFHVMKEHSSTAMPPASPTTAQSLGALLMSARDIMRKDKRLNGELDRLPMLTWVMFLKFLDDLETQREGEAQLSGKKFKPAIEPPYRWRDWAAKSDGITGEELPAFINNEETTRPGAKNGVGLFQSTPFP